MRSSSTAIRDAALLGAAGGLRSATPWAVLAYERGEFPSGPGISLAGAYRAALEWADEAHRAVSG